MSSEKGTCVPDFLTLDDVTTFGVDFELLGPSRADALAVDELGACSLRESSVRGLGDLSYPRNSISAFACVIPIPMLDS